MICIATAKSYCKDYTKIENYELAMNDKTQTWHCHHRNEQYYTRKDLIKLGLYFDCPSCELIFLTNKEHKQIHKYCAEAAERRRKISEANKGRKRPDLSEYNKNHKHMLGKLHSEEQKQKISNSMKGHKHSEETKRKISEAAKRRWENKKASLFEKGN